MTSSPTFVQIRGRYGCIVMLLVLNDHPGTEGDVGFVIADDSYMATILIGFAELLALFIHGTVNSDDVYLTK